MDYNYDFLNGIVNKKINNLEDVRTVITNVLFYVSFNGSYSRDEIINNILYIIKNNGYLFELDTIINMIDNSIDIFDRNDIITCNKGKYGNKKLVLKNGGLYG